LQPDDKIRRVVMCSGKVYFDLLAERDARGIDDIYLLRVEQLYPLPTQSLRAELARFPGAEMVWCQEEPKESGRVVFHRAQSGMGSQAGWRAAWPPALCGAHGLCLGRHGACQPSTRHNKMRWSTKRSPSRGTDE
jgi:hypothetical protein